MPTYDDLDWEELPDNAKEAATLLGYTPDMWDDDDEPDVCDEYWKDLTPEQQAAAAVLGYDEESWNDDDDE